MKRLTWLSAAFMVIIVSQSNAQDDFVDHLDNAARAYLAAGMLDSAADKLNQRALYFKEQNNLADYISAYVEIADLYVQIENYPKSQYYLNQIDPGTISPNDRNVRTSLIEWYLYQGYVAEKMGDYLAAKKILRGSSPPTGNSRRRKTFKIGPLSLSTTG